MKPKVLITRKLPEGIIKKISEVCTVELWDEEETPIPQEELAEKMINVDGVLCLLTENIDKKLIDGSPKLKVISNMAVGYNNIDIEAAKKKGIIVTNTPDVLTETTADLTFALLMATSRRLIEASTYLRNGEWKTWSPLQLAGQDIYNSTLGIIGMGRIGEAIAKRALGFNMNIVYYNRSRKLDMEQSLNVQYSELDDLLKESDFIVVMTPYTPQTTNLISEREFKLMKKSAILINTSRGGIVDEKALYDALVNKEIYAAGLDVFETEPINLNNRLLTLPNLVALPHIGSSSINTRYKMANLAAENLIAGVLGNRPKHVVS
ncbi:glyoxylate reductase [Chryseomicrobium aureum]|uniref:2-hydroxyacid dehydrogenase n=1 Tax=Chryseomicrobium aureum TaxID=1441723 RepID=UPI00195941F6|nr:D-glycerate dehydrogenase [Chryseomicrobium aureum]MBM7707309.1 glyoxylate reductase [Chryseomicrobium aureum]